MQQQQQQRIAAFLASLAISVIDGTNPVGITWVSVNARGSSCEEFVAEIIRAVTQAQTSHVLVNWMLQHLHKGIMTIAASSSSEEIPTIIFGGVLLAYYPPVPKLSKLDLEALYLSLLRARRPFHYHTPRRPRIQSVARHMIGTFLWTLVHRKRLRKIGRTTFERRGARMAVLAPGVRQLLRRKDDGNELAGVFKRQDVASVVAEYLGYAAW